MDQDRKSSNFVDKYVLYLLHVLSFFLFLYWKLCIIDMYMNVRGILYKVARFFFKDNYVICSIFRIESCDLKYKVIQ